MKRTSSRLVAVLGGAGYITMLVQWAWLGVVMLPWVLGQPIFEAPEAAPVTVRPAQTGEQFSAGSAIMAVGVTVIMIGVTIYILSKLPGYAVAKSSSIVHEAHHIVVPKVTPHTRLSARKKITLSSQTLFIIKLVLSLLPFVGLFAAMKTHPPLGDDIIVIVGLFWLAWSLVLIVAQRLAAALQRVDYSRSL